MVDVPKVLSLVIPTYNRSRYLDSQIQWAVQSIGEMWLSIELVVCDNASTDDTPTVCDKWREKLTESKFKVFRNLENVGLVKNCLLGIERAVGEFIWLIGDDDPINQSAVRKILGIINDYPKLSILHLNHRCVSGPTGEVLIPRFYDINKDIYAADIGASLLSEILQKQHTGGFMFITANVVNKRKALEFIENNPPEDALLLAYPMLLNAGLASQGSFYLLHECLLDCVYDQSSWSDRFEQVQYREVPHTLLKLRDMGVAKKAINYCLKFQFASVLSIRDILYRIRTQKGYMNSPELIQVLRRWKYKNNLKWKVLFL